jgi:gamma-glutamyltranspeptidase/glutathione hydrolase
MHGGNVVDAAVTTSAVLCVCQNNLCGLGGDFFALFKIGGGQVEGINGSGRAGKQATIEFYESRKLKMIPTRGPLGSLTVPGIVRAWGDMLSKFGTMELRDLLSPAIDCAENGLALTRNYVKSIERSKAALGVYDGWSKLFLAGDSAPREGSIFKQKDLANTLRAIATEGANSFYEGNLAEKIAKGVEAQGGLIDSDDLSSHTSSWDKPLKTTYRGVDIYETAPNSQAATVLLWLNMIEESPIPVRDGPESILSLLVPTCLAAYEQRAKFISDPNFFPLPSDFTTKEFAKRLLATAPKIRSPLFGATADRGDTTYFAVADSKGDCASVIQSNYMGFGSGLVPEGTGFVLTNRGCYFSLDRNHHNALAPRKRTFHTLCASIGDREGKVLFGLGSMGGDIQPQIHVQLITKILDLGYDIQEAIDAPRWIIPATIYERPERIQIERGLDLGGKESIHGLTLEKFGGYSSLSGHAQAVLFSEQGGIYGAADSRGDGAAVAF